MPPEQSQACSWPERCPVCGGLGSITYVRAAMLLGVSAQHIRRVAELDGAGVIAGTEVLYAATSYLRE